MSGGGALNQAEALEEIRSGKFRPIFLIYGGESFLEEEIYRAIRSAAVQAETADFNFNLIYPGSDQISEAINLARTQPFFAERRMVVVRDCPLLQVSRKSKEDEGDEEAAASNGEETLQAYLKNPVLSTCLLFLSTTGVDSRKRITKAIVSHGGAVECKPLKLPDSAMWAQRRAKSYGKDLKDRAAFMIVEKTGGDLRTIDTELQKLSLYVGSAREIKATDIDAAVGGVAETEIFRLTEAVMLRQHSIALKLLDRMLLQVDHPLQVLAGIINRFRQMLTVKALQDRGLSAKDGATQAKMHPFPYGKMSDYLKSYPRGEIVAGLKSLLATDLGIKSGQNPRIAVEAVVVELMSP